MANKNVVLEVGEFEIYDDGALIRIRVTGEDGNDGYSKHVHIALNREQAERASSLLESFSRVIQP